MGGLLFCSIVYTICFDEHKLIFVRIVVIFFVIHSYNLDNIIHFYQLIFVSFDFLNSSLPIICEYIFESKLIYSLIRSP